MPSLISSRAAGDPSNALNGDTIAGNGSSPGA